MISSAFAKRTAQNESIWRERIARRAASGKTIATFCDEEKVGKSTFSYWRRRLVAVDAAAMPGRKPTAVAVPFVDLGRIKATKPIHSSPLTSSTPVESAASIELRVELGNGVVLHIARH